MQNINKIIKVGIVLPDDEISKMSIDIADPLKYKINNAQLAKKLILKSENSSIRLNDNNITRIEIVPKDDINSDDYLTIKSAPIGRGFHWEKTINIKLSGKIIVENRNGYISIINELNIEEYLPFVATAEMSSDCPTALLEAQTIAARSWLLANRGTNHPDLNIDVCNDDCCQRFQGFRNIPESIIQSIKDTNGIVLIYQEEICDARYSKCCGGITESFENTWGGNPLPYLSSITDFTQPVDKMTMKQFISSSPDAFCSPNYIEPTEVNKYIGKVDRQGSYYRWNISYSQGEMKSILNSKLNLNAKFISRFTSLNRGFSGRIVKLKIEYIDKSNINRSIILNSEYDIRNSLHNKFLYSSAVLIEQSPKIKSAQFDILGAGWGHGVGMCQIGALGMALKGHSAEDILNHFYKDIAIEKIY